MDSYRMVSDRFARMIPTQSPFSQEAIPWPTTIASLISKTELVLQVVYLRLHLRHLFHECLKRIRIR